MATDPRNFLFNTDHQQDQIVFLKEGSFTRTSSGVFSIDIPHGLPFVPLTEMVWSHTADFAICQSSEDETYYDNRWTTMVGEYYYALSNGTNITILGNNKSGSPQTIYYRIWCFAPSSADVDSIVQVTSNDSDNFILNTDYNYMKLAYSGFLANNSEFIHNLGYIPRVKVWGWLNTGSSSKNNLVIFNSEFENSAGIQILDTKLISRNSDFDGYEYRIYYDS